MKKNRSERQEAQCFLQYSMTCISEYNIVEKASAHTVFRKTASAHLDE